MDRYLVGVLTIFVCALAIPQEASAVWKTDFEHQPLAVRPRIEARYTDATRTGAEIRAERYRVVLDLESGDGQRIRSIASGTSQVVGSGHVEITGADGKVYSSLHSKTASRINIYRRGPYYIETHWLDVTMTDSKGDTAPVKGEVIFYSYPERTHVGVILHVTDSFQVSDAALVMDVDADSFDRRGNSCLVLRRPKDEPTLALLYPVLKGTDGVGSEDMGKGFHVANYIYNGKAHGGACASWSKGDKPSAFFEILPVQRNGEDSAELEAELRPLLSTSVVALQGKSLGYDPIRGCYTIRTHNPGSFSYHFYNDPNAYEVADFSIQNDTLARKIYVLHDTGRTPGLVECGVVLDQDGNTLPVTVQISKNFSGEVEEPFYNPKDTPFSETIFPLYLDTGELRRLASLHLYQNWGTHPLKQFSSLGAWMDYYHMSTGVTETTCYVPFLFAGLSGVSIADFRPMSQRMWESQPQHDNIAGHSFLRYQDEKGNWHFVEYVGTTFRSTGPNWADMSMSYLSDDGKARVRIDVFELPQTDELRNFISMRVDFLDDISVKDAGIAGSMRLLNIASWVQGMRYKNIAYGGPAGDAAVVPISLNDALTVDAAPLPAENGWAVVYPDKRGANAFVVRSFSGRIDGRPVTPGVSLIGKKDGNTELFLVPRVDAKRIRRGDYILANIVLMPYGSEGADWRPAQKCALEYGLNAPKITKVTVGKKLSDFPTCVRLDSKGRAEFSITGGMNTIPVIVSGGSDYSSLRLYNVDGEKTLVNLSREGHKDGYQVFAEEDGTYGFVFLVTTDGKEHRYIAE